MNREANSSLPSGERRVVSLDTHPDTFTAAILRGQTPAQAVIEKIFNRVPLGQLTRWATKHTRAEDLVVLEASGNSFAVVRARSGLGRTALVLESCHLGKLKDAHANNDRISAVRIGKAYLAGTAKPVWVPDAKTQEWRDWFHAHRKAVKRSTAARNSLLSYLSDNGVRLKPGIPLTEPGRAEAVLRQAQPWSERQWQVLEGLLMALRHADEQRQHWRSLIAQEVAANEQLLSLVRLCGVRDLVAFALGAIIGSISRFASPGSLVNYVGLTPAFDDSGQGQWSGGIGGRGRKDLRALLIQAAQAIIRTRDHPLARWARKLMATKGSTNLAVAAVARRLTVAVWYLMNGRWTPLEQIDERLKLKLGKIISHIGSAALNRRGQTRAQLRRQMQELMRRGIYVFGGNGLYTP